MKLRVLLSFVIFFLSTFAFTFVALVVDSDAGGGDHLSGAEQVSVSDSESEGSAKCDDPLDHSEQDGMPETVYIAKEEGEIGSVS